MLFTGNNAGQCIGCQVRPLLGEPAVHVAGMEIWRLHADTIMDTDTACRVRAFALATGRRIVLQYSTSAQLARELLDAKGMRQGKLKELHKQTGPDQ